MNRTHPAIVVANQILVSCGDNYPLTVSQLNILVYICQGWALGEYDSPLINEAIQAQRFGPVVPSVYRKYKSFGKRPVSIPCEIIGNLSRRQKLVIDRVCKRYARLSARTLLSMMHDPDSPWFVTWSPEQPGRAISHVRMTAHYKKLVGGQKPVGDEAVINTAVPPVIPHEFPTGEWSLAAVS